MKKKTLTITFSLIMMIMYSIAQPGFGTLRGRITDAETKEPLAFANVILLKNEVQKAGGQSDINGQYVIQPISPGKYDILVSYIGYASQKVIGYVIGADKISFQNFELTESTVTLNSVEIRDYCKPLVEKDEGSSSHVSVKKVRKATIASGSKVSETIVYDDIHVEEEPAPGIVSGGKRCKLYERKETDKKVACKSVTGIPPAGPGILTAGELNDFSKWELWQDIAKTDLNTWQDYWKINPVERYTVQVKTSKGKPVIDCEVTLQTSDHKTIWTARTDNTGKAELWVNLYKNDTNKKVDYSVNVYYEGENYKANKTLKFNEGINVIEIPAPCNAPVHADVLFVVDATGSMGDELEYLKAELNDVIGKVKNEFSTTLNLGCVFYRDEGDEYVTKKSEFSTHINTTIQFIKQQSACCGGDEPEAVDKALDIAVNDMNWSENATARLLFLILDAPPHYSPEIISSLQKTIEKAASKGIRIIPVTGSGISKKAEYLMRAFALATNGTYVFLTDHSKVGNSHIKPTTDEYDVETLNNLLLRLFRQFLYAPSCDETNPENKTSDTVYVKNPKFIDHIVADSSRLGKFVMTKFDTIKTIYADSLVKSDTLLSLMDTNKLWQNDTARNHINGNNENFRLFRYYPNPTNGRVTIEIEGSVNELYLADISGKLLEKYQTKNLQKTEIDISKFPEGIYFLQYFLDNKWKAGKILLFH